MFDFLGIKPVGKALHKLRSQAAPNSLLDVVVPFPATSARKPGAAPENSSHDSLLSQFDVLAQKRQLVQVEKQAVERAELRAKTAAFERSEQMARIEAERDASLQFEEKANKLAAEIERVREAKFEQSRERHPETQSKNYQPSYGHHASHRNADRSTDRYDDGYSQADYNEHAARAEQGRYPGDHNQGPYLPPDYREREQFDHHQLRQRSAENYHSDPADYDYRQGHLPRSYPPGSYPNERRSQPREDDTERWNQHFADNRFDGQYDAARPAEPTHRPQDHGNYQSQYHAQPVTPSPANYRQPVAEPAADVQPVSSGGLYGQNLEANAIPSDSGLDLDKIFRSIIGSWKMIGLFAVAGAVLAGVYSKTLPNKYEAWAELLIDPQGITLIDKQLSSTGYGGEAMIAYLESQLRIIESTSVLNVVIDQEKLYDDPEFSESGSGEAGFLKILNPLTSGEESARNRQYIIDNLQDKLTIARGSRTFIVSIGMMTEDGEKSARIANAIAKAYVNGESGARSKVARDASENLTDKLETLRDRVLVAERKVVDYKAENGLVTSEGKLISEVQLSRINEQLAVARIETVNAKTRMEQLQTIDLSDVISGALPASLNTGTLSQLRVRYASLKSTADRLSTKLGPKHPERIAASAELESSREQISREIRRSIAGSQKDMERARERQKGLNQQLNTVKAAVAGTGNSLIDLRELERELEAHRNVYENYLLRSRETSEQEGLITTNARVITTATAPLEKAGPNRKVIAGVGLIAGGLIGLIFAMLKTMFFANKSSRSKPSSNEYEDNASSHLKNTGAYNPNQQNFAPYNQAGNQAPPYQPPRYR